MLVVPLSDIGEDGVEIEAVVAADTLRPEGVEALPVGDVQVSGVLEDLGGDYLFRGGISGAFEHACDRCLKSASIPFEVEVAWNFESDPKAAFEAVGIDIEDEADLSDSAMCRAINGEEIDLGPHVWEEVALALPFKFLCREDCKGLCPECGKDLNEGPCGCAPSPETDDTPAGNRGLAGLANLFPDLAPEGDAPEKQ